MKSVTETSHQTMDAIDRIFHALDIESQGYIGKHDLTQALLDRGIVIDDPRIRQTSLGLKKLKDSDKITATVFHQLVSSHITLIERALTGNLVIPDFKNFASFITNLYNRTLQNEEGSISDYIPELASVDPTKYALSVCTVDGQRFNIGDYNKPYLARETAKALNYCLAYEEYDEQAIHERVGQTVKETGFDYLMLNQAGRPHNPLTGSGALMIASMLGQTKTGDRFEMVRRFWKMMAGGLSPSVNEKAFSAERAVADADRALAYYMQQKGLFSKGSDINEHLDYLWRCFAIETTSKAQAVIAATLANAGVCPTSEQEVIKPATARNCLAIMALAGLKDASSEYAFSIGLPAIAGDSGVVLIVVPDVMGIAIWSPRVDEAGNSVKGLDFSQKLIERFNFHAFDSAIKNVGKIDPRLKKNETKMKGVMAVTAAASLGDLDELQRLSAAGVDLNEGEYDKRTGIHLAASEGHLEAVRFFIEKNVAINPKDRWGGTPLADAKREGHKAIEQLLKKHGGAEKA